MWGTHLVVVGWNMKEATSNSKVKRKGWNMHQQCEVWRKEHVVAGWSNETQNTKKQAPNNSKERKERKKEGKKGGKKRQKKKEEKKEKKSKKTRGKQNKTKMNNEHKKIESLQ